MKNSSSRWNLLALYLQPEWPKAALLAVLLLSSIGFQLAQPQILRSFIDTAVAGGQAPALLRAAGLFVAVALLGQAVTVLATYLGEKVGWNATNALRADLALHCLQLDMPFHNARTPGELIERVDGDVTALSSFFSQLVIRVFGSLLLLVGVLVALTLEDWRVGLSLAAFALVALFALYRSQNLAVPAMTADREANAGLFGFLEERLAGMDDIRANGAGSYVMRRFHERLRELYIRGRNAWYLSASMWIVTAALFTVGYGISLGAGLALFNAGAITVGTVYLFFQYTDMLRRPLEEIADQVKELQQATAGIKRVAELSQLRPAIGDGPGATFPEGPLEVEFDDVSFAYDAAMAGERASERALHNVTLRIKPGHVLGLVGRTGSGKTTITRLLFRLYEPAAGAIRLGGVDIRDARLEELRRRVGIVTQDVQLFHASIRDNLRLFDPTISDERLEQVLREVGLWEWCQSLNEGLDTRLAPGDSGLSAGEAQLLAFTRVFLRDPGLVILDEASSRLDAASERAIERAIDKLLHNRTAIIIAHRLQTVERADEIVVLANGAVEEYGRREELVNDPDSRFFALLQGALEEVAQP